MFYKNLFVLPEILQALLDSTIVIIGVIGLLVRESPLSRLQGHFSEFLLCDSLKCPSIQNLFSTGQFTWNIAFAIECYFLEVSTLFTVTRDTTICKLLTC